MIINTKGYVLNKKPYADFDEIITLLNEYGNKFTCICLGTRKINSKNGRNLAIGNYIDFEFFYSQTKMSKLKSAHTITYLQEKYKNNYTLSIMNDMYTKLELDHPKWFSIYQQMILNLLQDINDYVNLLICLTNVYTASGIAIDFNVCCMCKTPYHLMGIDFDHYGVVCKNCFIALKHLKLEPQLWEAYQKIQNGDVFNYKDLNFKANDLIKLIKQIMFFMHKNIGIYFSDLTILE